MGGNIVNKQGLTEEQFLSAYDASKFERPSVTVDMLVFTVTDEEKENTESFPKGLGLLMIKRVIIRLSVNGRFQAVL